MTCELCIAKVKFVPPPTLLLFLGDPFCASNPCQNGGICSEGFISFNCECLPGWTGPTCEENIDDCDPNPCQNGASCTDLLNDYSCECTPFYTGQNCEQMRK